MREAELDLITLGLDGAGLVKAVRELVALRNAVRAGEDATEIDQAVKQLDKIGDEHGSPDLGKKTLQDIRTAEHDAQASARRLRPPPGSDYETADELRHAVRAHIRNALEYAGENGEWTELLEHLANSRHNLDPQVIETLRRVHKLIRDPQLLEDAMVELWITAAREQITPQQALMRFFGGEAGMPILTDQSELAFEKAMLAEKPAIDDTFSDSFHGAYTHMFQEYVLARALGSREAARDVRQMIGRLKDPMRGRKNLASLVWDGIFDSYEARQINAPEELGAILIAHLNFPLF